MNFDYVIYGAGPTGLTLAYLLAKNNKKICLVEKDKLLGGCWKVKWQDDKYFTEHAPRVIMKDDGPFFKLLKLLNIKDDDFIPTYGNLFQTNKKIISFFLQHFNITDFIKLFRSILFNDYQNKTVLEWMNFYNISNNAKKALSIFSIALANSPDKLLFSEIINSSNFPVQFLQFKDNNKWINNFEKQLIKFNVKIFKNTSLFKLQYDSTFNKVSSAILKNNNQFININSNYHIITFPPHAFVSFLNNQDYKIKNNWIPFDNYNLWLEQSTYYSFGFQLHFKQSKSQNKKLDLSNKKWCWSCLDDYALIILPTSDYALQFSKDKEIKTVWSCTIVDTNRVIKKFNKTINQMSKQEIITDIIQRLQVKPDKITFYQGLEKINGKWISSDSAFSLGKSGIINQQGKITNLYTVGPHNKPGITVINKAVEIAVEFCKSKNFNTFNLQKNKYKNYLLYILIILVLLYYIYS